MPETVPRWLLAGAAIVAVITVFVGVKDFTERKSAVNLPFDKSAPPVVHSGPKSAPKTTPRTRRAKASVAGDGDSASNGFSPDAFKKILSAERIVQAGERDPFVADDGVQKERTGSLENKKRKAASANCVPLPNSTKAKDVDASYYQNWAREYGCGAD